MVTSMIALTLSVGLYFWQLFYLDTGVTEYNFRVEENDTVGSIAGRLKDQGIIKHQIYYYFTYYVFGGGVPPEPGSYKLSTDMQIRRMVRVLQQESWAKYVTIPAGLSKEEIGQIIGKKLGWGELDKQYFARTFSGMQWQQYQDYLEGIFSERYQWNEKKAETFLTLSALYYDDNHDFFKNMYEPGSYEIPVDASRAQVAGMLIDAFTKKHGSDRTTLTSYLNKKAMDNVDALIEDEMFLLPDIVAIPPLDVTLRKIDGRTYLLFTTSYWNQGRGPLEFIADPNSKSEAGDVERQIFQRIYNLEGGYTERLAGTFLWHDTHHHYHYKDFAVYNLEAVDIRGNPIAQPQEEKLSKKSTFCIRDYNPIDLSHPGARKEPSYRVCGKERQGISAGWADSYYYTYIDQKFDVTNFPVGTYKLTITINPLDRFQEITKDNNVGESLLSIDVKKNTVKVIQEKQYGI